MARGPALQKLGLVGSAAEGKRVDEVWPSPLAAGRLARQQEALAGRTASDEVVLDGRTYLLQTVPLYREEGEIYASLTLVQDVTEQKDAVETTGALLRLSEKLNATLNLETVLDTLTREAIKFVRAEGGFAGLKTDAGVVTHKYFQGEEAVPLDRRWAPGESVPGRLLQTHQPYLSNDADADAHVDPALRQRFHIRSLLAVPVLDSTGQMLAFLVVNNKQEGGHFDDEDRLKLVGLSQIAAIAIQNAHSFARLRELGLKVVSAQEEERRRLARELHDSAGQVLTALTIGLTMLQGKVAGDRELDERLAEAVQLAEQAYDEIRAASHALRPPLLDMAGLDATLRGVSADFARQTDLQIEYEGAEVPDLPDQVGVSFYRCLQEALTNIAKHAQASQVWVKLQCDGELLQLSVADDGVGMEQPASVIAGTGLSGLRERFELIGGNVAVQSQPGAGTEVIARYQFDGGAIAGNGRHR